MSRDDFVKRWRCHLAGLALYGVASETKDGTLARAARALEIPGEVERLLGLMYDGLMQGQNGQTNGVSKPAARPMANK